MEKFKNGHQKIVWDGAKWLEFGDLSLADSWKKYWGGEDVICSKASTLVSINDGVSGPRYRLRHR